MADLSPAALAVWHAYATADCDPYEIDPRQAGVAAALRAAADQLGTELEFYNEVMISAEELLAIAAELDNTSQPS